MRVKLTLLALTLIITGCGGGGGGGGGDGPGDGSGDLPDAPTATSAITGSVTKGPVNGASVSLFSVDANGDKSGSAVAGPFETDLQGRWAADIPDSLARPLLVESTGGIYDDEATGVSVTVGDRVLRSFLTEGQTTAPVTPLTEAVVKGAVKALAENNDATLDSAIIASVEAVQSTFGTSFDVLTDVPDINGSDPEAVKYALVLGGLSTLANDNLSGASATEYDALDKVDAISDDLSDGKLDGSSSGTAITVIAETETSPLTSSALSTSIGTFAVSESSSLETFLISVGTVVEGGSASLSDVLAFSGDVVELDLTPSENFALDAVTDNNCDGWQLNGDVITVGPIRANCELNVSLIRVGPDAVWGNFNWGEAVWQ